MKIIYLIIFSIFSLSCSSTKISTTKSLPSKGQRIGIGKISIILTRDGNSYSSDSISKRIGVAIEKSIIPYLHKAGFRAFNLNEDYDSEVDRLNVSIAADVDYILSGSGMVVELGSSIFVNELYLELRDIKSKEIMGSASFSGIARSPSQSGQKIGKALFKRLD